MKDEKISFSVSPRILAHLGEELIKSDVAALTELVKNSYDADALQCKVSFKLDDNEQLTQISVSDNGMGMTYDDIKKKWSVIGIGDKKASVCSPLGRYPLGEKGIGRLGVHKLGSRIKLYTKTAFSPEVHVLLDWINLEQAASLKEQTFEVRELERPQLFKDGTHGTRIVISALKSPWDKQKIQLIQSELSSLNSAHTGTNEEFRLEIECSKPDWLLEFIPQTDIKQKYGMYFCSCEMSGSKITSFCYEFHPEKTDTKVDKRLFRLNDFKADDREIYKLLKGSKKEIIDLGRFSIGTVRLEAVIFETDRKVFKLTTDNNRALKQYLEQNGGVRVYRDGMRVYDYGEKDNDWLGLNISRVHRLGGGISNNIIIGEVLLNRKDSTDLKEKTNREGFIENEAYQCFRDAVCYAMNIFIRERNVDKARLSKNTRNSSKRSGFDLEVSIQEAKDTACKLIKDPENQNEMLAILDKVLRNYNRTREVLIRSANVGLNFSTVLHELEKATRVLIDALDRQDYRTAQSIGIRLSAIIESFTRLTITKKAEEFPIARLFKFIKAGLYYRFRDHNISLQCPDSAMTVYEVYGVIQSLLLNLLDNAVFWLKISDIKNRKIAVFGSEYKEGYRSLVVADNGPGFNIPEDIAVEPFVSGKPDGMGMGLGLHIVNQYLISIGGKLDFPDINSLKLPDGIVAADYTGACVAICLPLKNKS